MRTGSLESLRELNRLRVVETLRERGTASRAEIARVTGLSRSTVSSLVADLQAQRPRGRVLRPRRPGQHGHRPPADAAVAGPLGRRRRRHRLRPRPHPRGGLGPLAHGARRGDPRRGRRPRRRGLARHGRRAGRRAARGDRARPRRRDRRRHGALGPDRPRPRRGAPDRDPPRLGGPRGGGGDEPAPRRPARPPRQRRQPRRARRGHARRGPRRAQRALRDDLLRDRGRA